MRHLALLFTLLLTTFGLAATAKALPLPPVAQPLPAPSLAAEENDEGDSFGPAEIEVDEVEVDEAEDEDEAEACDPEEDEDCETEEVGVDECPLGSARVKVATNSRGKVRLTVHYTASAPATVTLAYSLRGGKGNLQLGGARTQFQRAGVFHDSVRVSPKKLDKVLAARRFVVELHAVGAPGYCRERLTSAAPRRASRRHRGDA